MLFKKNLTEISVIIFEQFQFLYWKVIEQSPNFAGKERVSWWECIPQSFLKGSRTLYPLADTVKWTFSEFAH